MYFLVNQTSINFTLFTTLKKIFNGVLNLILHEKKYSLLFNIQRKKLKWDITRSPYTVCDTSITILINIFVFSYFLLFFSVIQLIFIVF